MSKPGKSKALIVLLGIFIGFVLCFIASGLRLGMLGDSTMIFKDFYNLLFMGAISFSIGGWIFIVFEKKRTQWEEVVWSIMSIASTIVFFYICVLGFG